MHLWIKEIQPWYVIYVQSVIFCWLEEQMTVFGLKCHYLYWSVGGGSSFFLVYIPTCLLFTNYVVIPMNVPYRIYLAIFTYSLQSQKNAILDTNTMLRMQWIYFRMKFDTLCVTLVLKKDGSLESFILALKENLQKHCQLSWSKSLASLVLLKKHRTRSNHSFLVFLINYQTCLLFLGFDLF